MARALAQPPSLLPITICFSQLRKAVAYSRVEVLVAIFKMQPLPSATPQSTAGGRSFCCPSPRVWTGAMAPCLPLGRGPFNSASQEPSHRDHPGRKHRQDLGMERIRGGGQSPHRLDEDRGGSAPGCAVPFSIRRGGSLRLRLGPAPPNPGVTALTSCRSQLAGSFSGRMMRGGGIRPGPSRQPLLHHAAGGPFRLPLRLNLRRAAAQQGDRSSLGRMVQASREPDRVAAADDRDNRCNSVGFPERRRWGAP